MKTFQYYFKWIFWSIFILITLVHFYIRGQKELDNSVKIKGKVVDIVPVREGNRKTQRKYLDRPQIEYIVDDSSYLYVDYNNSLEIGETPTLIYEKGNIRKIKVYTFWHWIDISFLIPGILISVLIYKVVIILSSRYKEPEILPSNL